VDFIERYFGISPDGGDGAGNDARCARIFRQIKQEPWGGSATAPGRFNIVTTRLSHKNCYNRAGISQNLMGAAKHAQTIWLT